LRSKKLYSASKGEKTYIERINIENVKKKKTRNNKAFIMDKIKLNKSMHIMKSELKFEAKSKKKTSKFSFLAMSHF